MVTLEYPAYLVDFTRQREEMRITKEEEESQSGSKVGTCALLAPQSAIFPSLSSRERFIQRWLLSVHRWCSWLGGTPQINSSDEGGAKPEKICRMDWCPDSPSSSTVSFFWQFSSEWDVFWYEYRRYAWCSCLGLRPVLILVFSPQAAVWIRK